MRIKNYATVGLLIPAALGVVYLIYITLACIVYYPKGVDLDTIEWQVISVRSNRLGTLETDTGTYRLPEGSYVHSSGVVKCRHYPPLPYAILGVTRTELVLDSHILQLNKKSHDH